MSRPLHYLDASALVKLVVRESETDVLRSRIDACDLVSSELVLTEVPRAIRRAAERTDGADSDLMINVAEAVLAEVALLGVDRPVLLAAGALDAPGLRSLDAIHVASAVAAMPIDAFVTYDERQAEAARGVGLDVLSPS